MSAQPLAKASKSALATGWQQGTIIFTTTDGLCSDQVVVKGYYGEVWGSFLPVIGR
jgi:hypothetical protein